MDTTTKDSRHRLLRSVFYICEAAFVASFAVIEAEWVHSPSAYPSTAFVFSFWISLLALLIVCFGLRRSARRLAVIGWITALIFVSLALMTPKL
jgi:peptidoglycan/LPS O-acetylase OafA/YrhL